MSRCARVAFRLAATRAQPPSIATVGMFGGCSVNASIGQRCFFSGGREVAGHRPGWATPAGIVLHERGHALLYGALC